MKFSKKTLDVLKNFAMINNTLRFNREGSGVLVSMNEATSVVAIYQLPEAEKSIPEFDIFDLTQLNAILKYFDDLGEYDIKFPDNKKLIIHNDNSRVNYMFLDKAICDQNEEGRKFPKEAKELPSVQIKTTLTAETLKKIKNMSSTLSHQNLTIKVKVDGNVVGTVSDVSDPTSNSFQLLLGKNEASDTEVSAVLHQDNLLLVESDYKVDIAVEDLSISKWSAQGDMKGLSYFIGLLSN
jgi:hypothetical protein